MSFSAGSMIARTSSGSRSSISSVEPLMSANSAVTVLRSPSSDADEASDAMRIAGSAGLVGSVWAADDGVSDAPQSPQKSSLGSFEAPQFGQERASAPPHFEQNLRPSRLSVPHFLQRISFPDCLSGLFWKWHRLEPVMLLIKQPLVAIRMFHEPLL